MRTKKTNFIHLYDVINRTMVFLYRKSLYKIIQDFLDTVGNHFLFWHYISCENRKYFQHTIYQRSIVHFNMRLFFIKLDKTSWTNSTGASFTVMVPYTFTLYYTGQLVNNSLLSSCLGLIFALKDMLYTRNIFSLVILAGFPWWNLTPLDLYSG